VTENVTYVKLNIQCFCLCVYRNNERRIKNKIKHEQSEHVGI